MIYACKVSAVFTGSLRNTGHVGKQKGLITIYLILSVAAMVLSIIASVLISYKKRTGLIIVIVCNAMWIIVVCVGQQMNWPQIAMFAANIVINLLGFFRWGHLK